MDLTSIIQSRRSIRRFKDKPVPREILHSILNVARWAPSAHNAQPWRCIIIEDLLVKKKLAKEMGEAWLSDMLKDGVPRDGAEEIIRIETWERIAKSPIVLIVCLAMEDMHQYPDRRRRKAEYLMAVQSVAAFIQNLLLAAHWHGLGACWICAPLFCQAAVRKALRLPKEIQPQAMIIMGYPDEKPSPTPRRNVEEFCFLNSYSNKPAPFRA